MTGALNASDPKEKTKKHIDESCLLNSSNKVVVLEVQPRAANKAKAKIMNTTQKTLLVTAAITGLVAGAVAKTRTTDNHQISKVAGKQVSSRTMDLAGCNGCGGKSGCSGKTNKVY